LPKLARSLAALPGCTATAETLRTKLEAVSGRMVFPGGLTASTRWAGGEPLVTGRGRPYDSSTLRRTFKAVARFGGTAVLESAVEAQVERAVGDTGRTAHAHTDMVTQPLYTKALTHAGPIGSLNHKLLAAVYFGVTTIRACDGPVLVYHLSWHKPASPLVDAIEDLHASSSRHAWLTAHLRLHTWDRGGNGLGLLRWAYAQQIPYLTVAHGWVYLSSQRSPMAYLPTHQPVFVRRDVRVEPATSVLVEHSPRVIIFPAHPEQGAACVRGLRYRVNGEFTTDEILHSDDVYKARWPEAENKFKDLKAIGFGVNRDRILVYATSRGVDGAIHRLETRDDVLKSEIEALREQTPTAREFAKIETRLRKQNTLRDRVDALRAQPLTKKVRPSTGLELLCKYLQLLLCNALALLLARSPIATVRALTASLVRQLLWGRAAVADITHDGVTLWVDPVAEARQRHLQVELLRLFNDEAPLNLHGARIQLRLAHPHEINSS
jgi:hypothetical protein